MQPSAVSKKVVCVSRPPGRSRSRLGVPPPSPRRRAEKRWYLSGNGTRSSGSVLTGALFLLAGGAWVIGCGTNASNLFFSSGLLLPGVGTNPGGGPLPSPTDDTTTADGGGGDGGGSSGLTTVCVTFVNDSNLTAAVDFFASGDGAISFQMLLDRSNLIALPETDQGCIDAANLTGNLSFVPRIVDGGRLSYQIDCVLAASLAFGALEENGTIGTEDEILGPLRQGVDFNCGDSLNVSITDDDQDGNLEIGF